MKDETSEKFLKLSTKVPDSLSKTIQKTDKKSLFQEIY